MKYGQIILLNGTSSSGKSTLAKKIQELSDDRYYHVQVDTMCNMMHPKFFENKNDFMVAVNSVITAMNNFVAMLSKSGECVIVDTVFELPEWLNDCVKMLYGLPVKFVKVDCPINELERREKQRGDRQVGMAKQQHKVMEYIKHYDVEVNTYEFSEEECAKKIIKSLAVQSDDCAFVRIYNEIAE